MLRSGIAVCLWVACIHSQAQESGARTQWTQSARALLASQSLSQRALGAREVYSRNLAELVPDIIRELTRRDTKTVSDADKLYTYTLFDALIQMRAVVPLDLLDRFYPEYMDEVVILWVLNPESNDRLMRARANAPGNGPWEAMTAALVARRDTRIAGALVREMTLSHTFTVTDDGRPVRGYRSVTVGPCGGVRPIDFPATGRYVITPDATQGNVVLVRTKFGTVYYRRQVLPTADTVAFREGKVPSGDAPIRLQYLADLLGEPWEPADVESVLSRRTDVRWRGQQALDGVVKRALKKQAIHIEALIAELKAKGLLDDGALRAVDVRIVPIVEDRREWVFGELPYVPPVRVAIE